MTIKFNAQEMEHINEWTTDLQEFPESQFIIIPQSEVKVLGFKGLEDMINASEGWEIYDRFTILTMMDDNDTANIYLIFD